MARQATPCPPLPRPGVSAAVFRGARVLLVQRAKQPLRGIWSLPGGHVEPGETVLAAAHRELGEETGIRADLRGVIDVVDVILHHADGSLRAHYVLTVFYGLWVSGEVCAASDTLDARWTDLTQLNGLEMTQGARGVIAKASARLGGTGP